MKRWSNRDGSLELLLRAVLQVEDAPVDLRQNKQKGGHEELRLDAGKLKE